MCVSSPKPAPPPVAAQPAPVSYASQTPQFDTEMADIDTAVQAAQKKKMGKGKLKVAPKADPSLSVGGASAATTSGGSSGVNVTS